MSEPTVYGSGTGANADAPKVFYTDFVARPADLSPNPAAIARGECGCFVCCEKRDEHLTGRDALFYRWSNRRMIVCETCGCKRCPHGTDHRHECTGSNEPGQPGSRYGGASA